MVASDYEVNTYGRYGSQTNMDLIMVGMVAYLIGHLLLVTYYGRYGSLSFTLGWYCSQTL